MERTYTVVLLRESDGRYSAIVPATGCASWGDDVPEALAAAKEALELQLDCMAAHGDPLPVDRGDLSGVELGDSTEGLIYRLRVGQATPVG